IARVLDRMDETVIGFDGEGQVACWNRAAQQRFGWLARAIWRHPGADFVRPENQEFGEWLRHLMAGRAWQGTLTVRTADGDDAQIAVRSVGLFDWDDNGKMVILVGARQCPEHAGGPESDTCPVCASRDQRQMLLSALSHELDAPVGLLGETARVLRRRVAAGDLEVVAELAADVGEQAERIRGMFRNVTVLAGLETELLLSPLAVAEVVTDAAETHLRLFPQRRLVVSHEGMSPPAMGERVALIEVLTNLLNNAEKFSPRGEEIRVETATAGGQVIVRVMDRGPGIPESEAERIFEPFYRAPGSTSPGMGLGLAVARRLSELMGAELTASRRAGGGAVFELRLRAALAEEAASPGGG
ncbi:MAG: ATP-binding protein, partial [Hyphomicrobiales bacterium]